MKGIWIIAKRELASYFDSLIAYMIIIIFLGISGFFTWIIGNTVFLRNQADLSNFFEIFYISLFLFIPAITMRSLAEEKKSGTIELLSTKAVSDWEIIIGKFLSGYILVLIALASTLPYYFTIAYLGSIDHGAVWGGYFGLMLISAAYVSIGIFASSLTNNQIIALLIAMMVGIFFHFLFDVLASGFTGPIATILNYLSVSTHFESLSRGVIDSRDLIYFFSLIFVGLYLSQTMLSKRNWQDA